MRVSTSMIFNNGTIGIQNRQSDLYKVQNQLSTGRRVLTPEDDPIGASEALQVSQAKAVNSRFLDNQANASSKLAFLESTLGSVGDELQNVYERAIQAGNGTYSPEQKIMIAEELKRRMENMIGLANTRDGGGQYIFAGNKTATVPFEVNVAATGPYDHLSSYLAYNGDSGRQTLQVTSSQEMATSDNGQSVFLEMRDVNNNVVARSMFDALQNMTEILDGTQTFATQADYQTAYETSLKDLQTSLDHVSTIRASVGARMQSLESLSSAGEDSGYLYDVRLSELQDLDYSEAISRFSRYQLQLEAAQLSFKQSSQLSLFNIL